MASILERGDYQWRVQIRRKGYPIQSRTFETKDAAEKWASMVERELDVSGFVDRREAEKTTLRAMLERYECEVTPQKKSADVEKVIIRGILQDNPLVSLKLLALSSSDVAAWRDWRLKEVSGATVNRAIDVLSSGINHARREWGIHIENPIPLVKRPEKAKARERRFTADEEKYLLLALSEIERRKNGTFDQGARNPWLAPLARLALHLIPDFWWMSISMIRGMRPLRGWLKNISNVLELSAVTGHKDLRMLKRYYHPKASDLAKKLG
jgi:hypothetical protein